MSRKTIIGFSVALMLCGGAIGGYYAFRAQRTYHVAENWQNQVRMLIENGGTIGEAPASTTFSANYLEAIFGADPELLTQLKTLVAKGLAEDPSLSLGEVAAMIISYRKNGDGKVEDVVATVVGGFPLSKRKLGFHRDGYFAVQLDENLWDTGNTMISFLGRDLVLFADEAVVNQQQELLESIFSGDILPLAHSLDRPIYFTAVFPDPKRIVPPQLRNHVQAFIMKGYLAKHEGSWETVILTPSPRSASYTLAIVHDLKLASLITLRSQFGGLIEDKPWGPTVGSWWAYEMANTLENTTFEKELNIVRLRSAFERVMVNVTLKTIERMGRDLSQMRGSLDERLDPRLVDARMRSNKPLNYWSEEHRWGPDWPIGSDTNVIRVGTPAEGADPANSPPSDT